MIIQSRSLPALSAPSAYGASAPRTPATPSASTEPATLADKVSISSTARARLTAESSGVDAQLERIKTKPAVERTAADTEYLLTNDKRLTEINAKDSQTLTADEVDYQQKASGFVNTMANLSASEKALYDEMVAAGNTEAVAGLNMIALARHGMSGQQVKLPDGSSFDPTATEITADNIRMLFKHMFVDTDGSSERRFEALASYLEQREPSAA